MSDLDVRRLHHAVVFGNQHPVCDHDAQSWPCETILALERE